MILSFVFLLLAVGALALAARERGRDGAGWLFIGLCGLIAGADHWVDVQTMTWAAGKAAVRALGGWLGMEDRLPALRVGAIFALLVLCLGGLIAVAFRTRSLRGPRFPAFLGLALLLVLLAARAAPPLAGAVPRSVSTPLEWACAALVAAGELWQCRESRDPEESGAAE